MTEEERRKSYALNTDSRKKVIKKYLEASGEATFDLSETSYRSEIIKDFNSIGGMLSLNFLKTLYSKLKVLEKRQKEREKSLDDLLS